VLGYKGERRIFFLLFGLSSWLGGEGKGEGEGVVFWFFVGFFGVDIVWCVVGCLFFFCNRAEDLLTKRRTSTFTGKQIPPPTPSSTHTPPPTTQTTSHPPQPRPNPGRIAPRRHRTRPMHTTPRPLRPPPPPPPSLPPPTNTPRTRPPNPYLRCRKKGSPRVPHTLHPSCRPSTELLNERRIRRG